MYKSGITAAELIESVKEEVDISLAVSESAWVRAINAVEQFLYTEVLKEYIAVPLSPANFPEDGVALGDIPMPNGAAVPEFDDIIRVFADENEVERAGAVGFYEFPEKQMYCSGYDGTVRLNLTESPAEIVLIVRLRPSLKGENSADEVALPPEFIDLVAARMRGEIYKIANEDGLAAKWLSDYNSQLETFKVWAAKRNERFGG